MIPNRNDLATGAIALAVGLVAGGGSLAYKAGSAGDMGPGFFPLVVSGFLLVLGVIRVFVALRPPARVASDNASTMQGWDDSAPEAQPIFRHPVVIVSLGALAFALLLDGAGLVPAIAVMVLISALAGPRLPAYKIGLLTAGLAAGSAVLFVEGLGLPIPLLGSWWP